MRQETGSALVQVMACRLFGAKTSPELILPYCKLDPKEQTSVKLESKYKTIYSLKCIWNYRLQKLTAIYPLRDELTHWGWKSTTVFI